MLIKRKIEITRGGNVLACGTANLLQYAVYDSSDFKVSCSVTLFMEARMSYCNTC